jgi:hypothetical protein
MLFLPVLNYAQNTNFEILPYLDGTASINDGLLEVGAVFNWEKIKNGKTFSLRPTIRIPLTNKSDNMLQIDRFSSSISGIASIQYTIDNTEESGSISRNSINGQIEYGYSDYKYYPYGNYGEDKKESHSSYACEIKYIGFFTEGAAIAQQFSPQFRLRYSYNWKASGEVGVVNPPDNNGVITTTDMIIGKPWVKAVFSPAFSLQFYPGEGKFSYSPTLYYDFNGKNGTKNPFKNVQRVRVECWMFFYPVFKDNPNVKFGISPFVSVRTSGLDDYNKIEYGGIITIKFGTTFLQFF